MAFLFGLDLGLVEDALSLSIWLTVALTISSLAVVLSTVAALDELRVVTVGLVSASSHVWVLN